jgi:hypothetical protein
MKKPPSIFAVEIDPPGRAWIGIERGKTFAISNGRRQAIQRANRMGSRDTGSQISTGESLGEETAQIVHQ